MQVNHCAHVGDYYLHLQMNTADDVRRGYAYWAAYYFLHSVTPHDWSWK